MAGKLTKKRQTRRDAADAATLRAAGDPSHINPREDALLRRLMPEAHGEVITRGLLAEAGRRGDDRVTKLIPAEAALLRARGGSGAVNPATGLLEYNNSGDQDDGSDSNTSNAGENTGGMDGTPDSGVSEGPGANGGYGSNDGGNVGYRGYDARTMPSIESLLNAPNGYRAPGYEDLSMNQYSPPDTWGRLLDTYTLGPPRSYTQLGAVPGRYGGPTGRGPGIVGTAINGFIGGPLGNPMSMVMDLGMHFDQAMSPQTRAASLAHNQATGAMNSTGSDPDNYTGLTFAELDRNFGSTPAGADSGANTTGLLRPGGDHTNTPDLGTPASMLGGGDSGAHTRAGLPQPVENLLMDYIWRGRQGWGW